MHGIGNDFVMVNGFETALEESSVAELARAVCDRRFGVGSDGLIVASSGTSDKFAMRMWNPDGSESEMCGNGIRCFAVFVRDQGLTQDTKVPVETGAGRLVVEVTDTGKIRVDMGRARILKSEIDMSEPDDETFLDQRVTVAGHSFCGSAVSMGNPHLVMFVDDLEAIELSTLGPSAEHLDLFPNRVNAHWVKVDSSDHITIKTWERGAGATLACGTGACACAVASFLTGRTGRQVVVSLPGGDLEIEYLEDGTVMMTGPAENVFEGQWPD